MWVFGTGPFNHGTIRRRTELAGAPLPSISGTILGNGHESEPRIHALESEHVFPLSDAPAPAPPIPAAFQGITGAAALSDKTLVH
jgi:hypothetical protein